MSSGHALSVAGRTVVGLLLVLAARFRSVYVGWPRKKPPDRYGLQILSWQVFCRRRILQERWR